MSIYQILAKVHNLLSLLASNVEPRLLLPAIISSYQAVFNYNTPEVCCVNEPISHAFLTLYYCYYCYYCYCYCYYYYYYSSPLSYYLSPIILLHTHSRLYLWFSSWEMYVDVWISKQFKINAADCSNSSLYSLIIAWGKRNNWYVTNSSLITFFPLLIKNWLYVYYFPFLSCFAHSLSIATHRNQT